MVPYTIDSTGFPTPEDVNMSNSAILSASDDVTVMNNISFTNTPTIDTQNHSIFLYGLLTGSGSLTKDGIGDLFSYNAGNNYSGGTNLSSGGLWLTLNDSTYTPIGSGDLNMSNGTICEFLGGPFTVANNINVIGATATVRFNSGSGNVNEADITGNISGNASVETTGIVKLHGNNSHISTTVNPDGRLYIYSANSLGNSSATLNLGNNSTLFIDNNNLIIPQSIALGSDANLSATNATISGSISGVGRLAVNVGGALTLTGVNSPVGFNLQSGMIKISSNSALGTGSVMMSTGTVLDITTASAMSLNNLFSGLGSVNKNGTARLTITRSSSFSGGTNVNAGIVAVTGTGRLGTGPINLASGTVLEVNPSSNNTLSNKLTGAGSLSKLGTFGVTLGNIANDFTGGISHNAGTISVTDVRALSTGAITMANNAILSITPSSDMNLNNIIAGAGSITKAGPNNLTIGGNNSFSAGINHTAGTITAAHPNAFGTGAVTMTNDTILAAIINGTIITPINLAPNNSFLNVDTNYDATFSQITSNNGSNMIKGGGGNLNITSTVNHQGTTEVNAGSLSLIDAALGGQVTIGINGILKGSGNILGNIINNGIVSPGFSPSFSNGVIGATNYIGNPGSLVQLAIKPAATPVAGTDYSQITASGTATITDSNLVVNADNGSYADGSRYDLVTAGTVIGEFNNFTLNITGPYEGHLTYDSQNVSLLVSRTYIPPLPNDNSLSTKHASDLSSYVDSLTNMSTDLRQVLDVLYELGEKDLDNALRSITPNRNLTADYVGQDASALIHGMNNVRLSMASNESFVSNNQAGFATNSKQDNFISSSTKSNLINSITSNLGTNLINSDQDHIWAAPFLHFSRRDTTNQGRGYNAKTGGMILGYDHKFSPIIIGGISLGYYQNMFEHHDHGGKDNKIKTTFLTAYGRRKLGKAYLNGSLFMAYNNNYLKRQINITNLPSRYASSKHNSYTLSPRLELGYNFKNDCDYKITPFIGIQYATIFDDSYMEENAEGINMKVKRAQNQVLNNELGIKLRKAIKLENDKELVLRTKLSYLNKKRFKKHNLIQTGFADQNSTYISANDSKIEHQISPGIEIELVKESGITIGASYNGEFSKSYHAHEGMLKIGIGF